VRRGPHARPHQLGLCLSNAFLDVQAAAFLADCELFSTFLCIGCTSCDGCTCRSQLLPEDVPGKVGGAPGNAFELVYGEVTDRVREKMTKVGFTRSMHGVMEVDRIHLVPKGTHNWTFRPYFVAMHRIQ
jgi:hypothetical protein